MAVKGDIIVANVDKAILSKMHLKTYIETDFVMLGPDDNLGAVVEAISAFPTVIYSLWLKPEKAA
ncbi:MAG: hypothetical protein U0X76_02465 [Bacteroidia bacterium]